MIACFGLIVAFASCSKKYDPVPEPVGDAKVKFVNTVFGSLSQDVYVNGVKKSVTPVAYGTSSEYFTITSGNSTFSFNNAGTTTATATASVSTRIGDKFMALYYKNAEGTLVAGFIADDATAAVTGKANVRFIHMNNFLKNIPLSVSVVGESTAVIPSVDYLAGSKTIQVAPGAKFTFAATGVITAPVLDGSLAAGKNYTIWIDGNSSTELTGHVIEQN